MTNNVQCVWCVSEDVLLQCSIACRLSFICVEIDDNHNFCHEMTSFPLLRLGVENEITRFFFVFFFHKVTSFFLLKKQFTMNIHTASKSDGATVESISHHPRQRLL